MTRATIQDWTETDVVLSAQVQRGVRYQVFRDGEKTFLDMRDTGDEPIHTLELPDGMKLG